MVTIEGQPGVPVPAVRLRIVGAKGTGELSEAVAWYVRDRIEAWINAEPGRTGAQLARELGISKQQVGDIRKTGRGAGIKSARALAKLLGLSLDEFERQGEAAHKKRAAEAVRIVRPDRYANRVEARGIMAPRVRPAALERIDAWNLDAHTDPSVAWWMAQIEAIDDALRREESEGPAKKAARNEQLREDSEDVAARTRPPDEDEG